jgi:hypothetical protein
VQIYRGLVRAEETRRDGKRQCRAAPHSACSEWL